MPSPLIVECYREAKRIGDHKKNSVAIQRDICLFTNTVKATSFGELSLLSVPKNVADPYIEPISWGSLTPFIKNGHNPKYKAGDNLSAAAATRIIGGMGGHWTCCTPLEAGEFVEWACTATMLVNDLADPSKRHDRFKLRANTQCVRLVLNKDSGQVEAAELEDLLGA
ncbi:hypothetical protein CORC01_01322 [Colletotrichum orchidophilum]|uniref:Uncharacterized protein n=1 Tax=Colletotrichum orchidophilum TaxID=1209926 RepID=A0A1G4BP92_9PEZI|nr:uncharacterized protein CORC01_01322 [Colletotrichum orchidophilum]OHF03269.1 hypothetical protein CORC01_01322 [Colletotrichum orchidophilum]